MNKSILSVIIKSLLVAIGTSGIIATYFAAGYMSRGTTFLYFTIQSNITIIAITAFYLFDAIGVLFGRKPINSQILLHVKFCFTVAITITFIVFVTLLAPLVGVSYFFSYSNFSLHIIVPLLAIADFILFDINLKIFLLRPEEHFHGFIGRLPVQRSHPQRDRPLPRIEIVFHRITAFFGFVHYQSIVFLRDPLPHPEMKAGIGEGRAFFLPFRIVGSNREAV